VVDGLLIAAGSLPWSWRSFSSTAKAGVRRPRTLDATYNRGKCEGENGTALASGACPDASGLRLHEQLANSETDPCPANLG
jgi:hypothetical protein